MSELWADSIIDREWLEWFGQSWKIYNGYKKLRIRLINKINSLKSIDYSKDKVINGASIHVSEQERFVLKLEKINKLITEAETVLLPAKKRLIKQIVRIKNPNHRAVLILYFVERRKLTDIVEYIFDVQLDYEEKKDTTYLDCVKRWKREAIEKLEELNNKAYVPVKQLQIGV